MKKKRCCICDSESGKKDTYEEVEHCRKCGRPVCGYCYPACCDEPMTLDYKEEKPKMRHPDLGDWLK